MEPNVILNITLKIEKGRGYIPSEENINPNDIINTIAIDSIHTPIKNVKYEVENFRVEQKTDYEKLVLEITTDGSANFIINASDEEGIKKVEFVINKEEQYVLNLDQVLPLEQRKEFQYSYPLKDGENNLKVIVYNESNISETYEVVVRK